MGKLKKINALEFENIIQAMDNKDISAVGSYNYNGFHVQISEYGLTTSERVSRLYHRRREKGLCVVCGKRVTKKNKKTNKLYRLCETHRKEVDKIK